MLLAVVKRRFSFAILRDVVMSTATITSMVFVILFGAAVFSIVFRPDGRRQSASHEFLTATCRAAPSAPTIIVMLIMFLLGFILDTFEIIFIVIPITAPILLTLGVDPIWLGVTVGVNLQTSFLTPPFGFSLFYLRGVAPRVDRDHGMIYRGVIPFVALQMVGLTLVWIFPQLATWLPALVFK